MDELANSDYLSRLRLRIDPDLAAVNACIRHWLHSEVPLIPTVGEHLIAAGGKLCKEEQAKREAEERARIEEQAKREAEEAETRRRQEDEAHRSTVMRGAKEALMEHAILDEGTAKRIVLAIKDQKIPNVAISS